MKKIFPAVVLLLFVPFFAAAQNCKEPFLGSKTLYKPQQQQYKPAPAGYRPVFINHAGRHGARHLTKEVNTYFLYQMLLKADSSNGLTEKGKLLKKKVLNLEKTEQGAVKSISEQGKTEQQGIAKRMYSNYATVFKGTKTLSIKVDYTKEIRTLQTSEAFLSSLRTQVKEPSVSKKVNDSALRFYDMSAAYDAYKENGSWKDSVKLLKKTLHYNDVAKDITALFFTASFLEKLDKKNIAKITEDLYSFITISFSLQKEITAAGLHFDDANMQSFLTCSQLAVLSRIDNTTDYFEKGPGEDLNGIQVTVAAPLLKDFIRTSDDYIEKKQLNACLRFCHAETIAPFASLLGLNTAAEKSKNINNIAAVWNAAGIIPLSANIQWVFYKKGKEEKYLVKFLLNEKEAAVNGLTTRTFPFYDWDVVKAFYIRKLHSLHIDL